jgi:hypothetical protein
MYDFSRYYKRALLLLLLLLLVVMVVVVVTVVVVKGKFVLVCAMKAHMESRGIAPFIPILGTMGSVSRSGRFTLEKRTPVHNRRLWVGDRPARSRTLYWLQ